MSTQQDIPTVSSSSYGGVKAWLYNNYVDVENAAAAADATSNDAPPALLSRAQFDRIHLKPMIAGFAQASLPRQLKEPRSIAGVVTPEAAAYSILGMGARADVNERLTARLLEDEGVDCSGNTKRRGIRAISVEIPSLASESEVQSGVDLLSPIQDNYPPSEILDPMGSVQYAHSECSSDDYYMIDSGAELGCYALVHGLSFCSAYEEARLENAALEGYNADVEDNADSLAGESKEEQKFSASDGIKVSATTETTWSDPDSDFQDDEADFIASRIDNSTAYHRSEMDFLDERAVRILAEKLAAMPPPSKTMVEKIESGPQIRAWAKQMDRMHARERQTAWDCAAWALQIPDESRECYAVLKGKFNTLHERQREDREAILGNIETRRASDAEMEAPS